MAMAAFQILVFICTVVCQVNTYDLQQTRNHGWPVQKDTSLQPQEPQKPAPQSKRLIEGLDTYKTQNRNAGGFDQIYDEIQKMIMEKVRGPPGHEVLEARGPPGREVLEARGPPGREVLEARGPPGRQVLEARGPPGREVLARGPAGREVLEARGPPGRRALEPHGPPGHEVLEARGLPGREVLEARGSPGREVLESRGPPGREVLEHVEARGPSGREVLETRGPSGRQALEARGPSSQFKSELRLPPGLQAPDTRETNADWSLSDGRAHIKELIRDLKNLHGTHSQGNRYNKRGKTGEIYPPATGIQKIISEEARGPPGPPAPEARVSFGERSLSDAKAAAEILRDLENLLETHKQAHRYSIHEQSGKKYQERLRG